jgi:hypothetical protein
MSVSYLIDQLPYMNLTEWDSSFLAALRTLRNKSADPPGHRPSPEEARFILYGTASRFLAKPILSTTHLINQLTKGIARHLAELRRIARHCSWRTHLTSNRR